MITPMKTSRLAAYRHVLAATGPAPRAARLGSATLLLAIAALVGLLGLLPPPSAVAQASPCSVGLTRTLSPSAVTLGDEVAVTLKLQATCPKEMTPPLHVVFALDVSGSMAGQRLTDTLRVVQDWAAALDLAGQRARVGLVAFNDLVVRRCELVGSLGGLNGCLAAPLKPQGGSDLALGLVEALSVLSNGRRGLTPAPNEVLILLADGGNTQGCAPAVSAARQAKGQGVLVITVCIGAACDAQCLRQTASSARYHFSIDQADAITASLVKLQDAGSGIRRINIEEALGSRLAYVADSAQPTGAWDPGTKSLSWEYAGIASEGLTITYRIRPLEVGSYRSGASTNVRLVDSLGQEASSWHLPALLTVWAVSSGPQPNVIADLALARTSLAIGQQSAVTVTLGLDLPEPPGNTHLVLVADRSGSMTGEPMAKLIEGGREMLDRLEAVAVDDFAAAIVRFNNVADLVCPLTGDFGRLRGCVDKLGPAEGGTAIDLGLREGLSAFDGHPAWEGGRDVVLFSDGQSNSGCDPVKAVAQAIKAEGIVLHTVCLGAGCDAICMREAASSPRHFFEVPLAENLPQTLGGIAQDLLARRGVEGVNLDLKVPPHLRLVPGSFTTAPKDQRPDGASWQLPRLPHDGLRLSFAVEAVAGGSGPLELSADLPLLRLPPLAGQARSGVVDVPVTPSPTALPSPTLSPTAELPTAMPGTPPSYPTAIPTPNSSPTGSRPLYLPALLSEQALGDPVDLVLLVDSSLSMGERLDEGGTKLAAAQAAVEVLLEQLDLDRHRVALVSSDAEARQHLPLGQDRAALRQAMATLPLGAGTALDKGLTMSTDLLLGEQRRGMTRGVILLLSDGRAHEARPIDAVAAADRARRLKVEVYTVGLGREVDARTLTAIADSQGRYQGAPDRATLLRAFHRLAAWMDRPAESLWSGR